MARGKVILRECGDGRISAVLEVADSCFAREAGWSVNQKAMAANTGGLYGAVT